MFRRVVNPPLRNMVGAFAKIDVDLLSVVANILSTFGKRSILHVFADFLTPYFYVFSSYLRPHKLVQYANLTKVNFLD